MKSVSTVWPPLRTGVTALVFATALLLGYREIFSWDIGFHLSAGRWMAEHGAVIRHEWFTYTLRGRPYIDLHWLYQWGVWALYRAGGTLALVLGHLTAALAAMGMAARRTRMRNGRFTAIGGALLFVFALGHTWEPRPQVFSWLLLNMVLLLLERHRRTPDRAIWLLPPIMALWVNVQSLFAVGLVVIAVYAGWNLPRGKRAHHALSCSALLCLPACLFNPHGWKGFTYPWTQFLMLSGGSVFKSSVGIYEFMSPLAAPLDGAPWFRGALDPHTWMVAGFIIGMIALPFAWRRASREERTVYILMLYVFVTARRNHGFFVLATLPMMSIGLERAADGLGKELEHLWSLHRQRRSQIVVALFAVCLSLFLIYIGAGRFYRRIGSHDRIGHRFNRDYLPVGAAEFLNRPDIPEGRMLNALHDGGYLHFATRRPVYCDGRLEIGGPDFYRHCMSLTHPDRLSEAVRALDVQFAVVPHRDVPVWMRLFMSHPAWRCVYADGYAAVFFRRDFAPRVPAVHMGPSS